MASVIIVEDDLTIAMGLKLLIEGMGHSVVGPYPSASRAHASMQNGVHPDLALLDVQLRNGELAYDLARVLLSMGIKIIFVTARSEIPSEFQKTHILKKPYHPTELIELINGIIGVAHDQSN